MPAAVYAGLGVWLLGYFLPTLTWIPMGLFPARLVTIAAVVGLVEILLATLAGAWLYQEQPEGAAAPDRQRKSHGPGAFSCPVDCAA